MAYEDSNEEAVGEPLRDDDKSLASSMILSAAIGLLAALVLFFTALSYLPPKL